jgi:hypothetical protein
MYNQKTISINVSSASTYDEIFLEETFNKGDLEVTFDISELETSEFTILKAVFILDNDVEPLLREYVTSEKDYTEKYLYTPPETDAHTIIRFPVISVLLNKKNTSEIYHWVYIIPIQCMKTSFFSEHGRLEIVDSQFCNDNSTETIVMLQNSNGRILNFKIQ